MQPHPLLPAAAAIVTVWIIVLHFSVSGISAAVLPMEKRQGFADKTSCEQQIGGIKRGWSRLALPAPDKITCERFEVK